MSFFQRKKPVPHVQPGSIQDVGFFLEQMVRRELGLPVEWELHQMEMLFIWLMQSGFVVVLAAKASADGWMCVINRGDITPEGDYVREYSNASPATALARGAVAAVREWGVGSPHT